MFMIPNWSCQGGSGVSVAILRQSWGYLRNNKDKTITRVITSTNISSSDVLTAPCTEERRKLTDYVVRCYDAK